MQGFFIILAIVCLLFGAYSGTMFFALVAWLFGLAKKGR